jgi:hypothetical protein
LEKAWHDMTTDKNRHTIGFYMENLKIPFFTQIAGRELLTAKQDEWPRPKGSSM